MSELLKQLQRATGDLDSVQAKYALVGGLAVSLRTEPRFTRDLDIAIAVETDQQAEALIRQLIDRGYAILLQSEHETANRLATIRLAMPERSGVVVDLLFASSGIEDVIVSNAEMMEALPGWQAPVARSEHLLAMKLLASDPVQRPQDHADAIALLRGLSAEQVKVARQSLQLIVDRGYNRKRDLLKLLNGLLNALQ